MEFLILPDCRSAEPVVRAAARPGLRVVPHASGRPWLVGDWDDGQCTLITSGTRSLALLGHTRADAGAATRALRGASSPDGLDALARSLPGSFHLAASFDGRTRTQGSLSTARQVFHTTVHGVTVAADSPAGLVTLTGARIDDDALALQLLQPIPHPLTSRPLWQGVESLGVGHWLEVLPDGTHRSRHWWSPPAAEVPLSEAAGTIRDALADSVAARAHGQDVLSADLSGGLDSTSLCFLAAASDIPLVTNHWKPRDEANADTEWARIAAASLPSARHRFVETKDAPDWYDAQARRATGRDDVEGPLLFSRNRAHMEQLAQDAAGDGAAVHLIGLGGDELFGVAPLFAWSLIRRNPLLGIRMAHRFGAVNRWSLATTVRSVADRTSFAHSLDLAARQLDAPQPPRFHPPVSWGRGDPRMPPWVTRDAVESVRRRLREAAAAQPPPLDRDRVQHQTVEVVVQSGHGARQLSRALRPYGVEFEAPFLDDRVLEAALSVRVRDRVVPGKYKPVLVASMRGTVPDAVLDRRDKGSFGREAYEGLYRNRERLAGLCADLRLADRGLVDADALRTALLSPVPDVRGLGPFETTLSCETWLRSPSSTPHIPAPAGGVR
ncbi:asparagine synthase-related protein [Streptomyces sp. NPDC058665]|uniref:asparagine synthase-related protein n=1 Tax=Streptomyces sp. NPDC058665 TaxID=3346586 RepID=UPI00365D420F